MTSIQPPPLIGIKPLTKLVAAAPAPAHSAPITRLLTCGLRRRRRGFKRCGFLRRPFGAAARVRRRRRVVTSAVLLLRRRGLERRRFAVNEGLRFRLVIVPLRLRGLTINSASAG